MRALLRVSLLGLALFLTPLRAGAAEASYALEMRDQNGAPLEYAVVTLYPLDRPAARAAGSDTPTAIMDQRNEQFVPHVLPVARGTEVTFPNSDNMRHHVYSFSPAKRFELALYSGLPPRPVVFDQVGEVVLGCNIHDHMIGYIYVVDSPFFGVTGRDGRVRIAGLPPGRFRSEVWHPHGVDTLAPRELVLGESEEHDEARTLRVHRDGLHRGKPGAHGAP